MTDRHRIGARPELALARRGPAIPAIAQVLAEQPQIRLVTPDRRQGQPPLSHQQLRPLLHLRRAPVPRVLVGEPRNRQTRRSRGAIVSSRSPRAVCWARHPRSIASNIASSGRSCTTPDTSSRCAAPARSIRPNPPSSPRNRNRSKPGSCTRRDHRATGEVRPRRPPAARGHCGTGSPGDQRKRAHLMQFPRVPVHVLGDGDARMPEYLGDHMQRRSLGQTELAQPCRRSCTGASPAQPSAAVHPSAGSRYAARPAC